MSAQSDSAELMPYVVPAKGRNAKGLRRLVEKHPNIRFISLVGVDLGGNETDERIPVATFLPDAETLLAGGVQTDGSSVVLPGIATLNDGKVDLIADPNARWTIDYNESFRRSSNTRASGSIRARCWRGRRRRWGGGCSNCCARIRRQPARSASRRRMLRKCC
jgi:glutamine synthetase